MEPSSSPTVAFVASPIAVALPAFSSFPANFSRSCFSWSSIWNTSSSPTAASSASSFFNCGSSWPSVFASSSCPTAAFFAAAAFVAASSEVSCCFVSAHSRLFPLPHSPLTRCTGLVHHYCFSDTTQAVEKTDNSTCRKVQTSHFLALTARLCAQSIRKALLSLPNVASSSGPNFSLLNIVQCVAYGTIVCGPT